MTDDDSMLDALAAMERDEQPLVRRFGALVLLLVLTAVVALAVGFGIYRGVSAFK